MATHKGIFVAEGNIIRDGHILFLPCRAAETQTLANHRRAFFPKYPMVPESSRQNWSFSKEGRKQV